MIDKDTVEGLLYDYKNTLASIENLKLQIEEMEYVGCKGVSYGERTQSTNAFSSSVENEMLDRQRRQDEIADRIFMLNNMVRRVANALGTLSSRELEIIKLKYFEKYIYEDIEEELELSRTTVIRLKNDALERLKRLLY